MVAQPQHEGAASVHVARVQGVVANARGLVVPGAEVELLRDGKVLFTTQTDADGIFDFQDAHGPYTMRVKPAGYSPATREIVVGELAMIVSLKNTLYVLVGPAACAEECSSVFTSKREFERAIRRKSGQSRESRSE